MNERATALLNFSPCAGAQNHIGPSKPKPNPGPDGPAHLWVRVVSQERQDELVAVARHLREEDSSRAGRLTDLSIPPLGWMSDYCTVGGCKDHPHTHRDRLSLSGASLISP